MTALRTFRLQATEFRSPACWRWDLRDEDEVQVAEHDVALDPACPEYTAMTRLQFSVRSKADPKNPFASQAAYLDGIGRWMGENVLGAVGPALAANAPTAARVVVPAERSALLTLPLELSWAGGRPLAVQSVSFVFDVGAAPKHKQPIGDRLRMLALFSLPVEESLLVLRQQRHALERGLNAIAKRYGKAIHVRSLQYGVTRGRLRDFIEEGEGWDIVHFSGHGLATKIVLEREGGGRDPVPASELLELLEPVRPRLKLLVLSSCDSGAAAAHEALRVDGDKATDDALPGLATQAARDLDCAVLGMRYLVGDDFAIDLADALYDSLIGKANVLPRALQLALPKALPERPEPGKPALSVATPALFGQGATSLSLAPPDDDEITFAVEREVMAGFPSEPDHLVGHRQPLSEASAVLTARDGGGGVLFLSDQPTGKTACALELAYRFEHEFRGFVFYEAPAQDGGVAASIRAFARSMDQQLKGFRMEDAVKSEAALKAYLPQLRKTLEKNAILIVVDGIERLLSDAGTWRNKWWSWVRDALAGHQGLSRVVLTSRRAPEPGPGLVTVEVPPLTPTESVLLARQLPALGRILRGRSEVPMAEAVPALAKALAAAQGRPGLIKRADELAADLTALPDAVAGLAGEPGDAAVVKQFETVLKRWTQGVAA